MSKLSTDAEDLKRLFREKGVVPRVGSTGLYVKDKVLQCDSGCAIGALLKGTPWDSEDTTIEPASKVHITDVYHDYARLLGVTMDELGVFWHTVDDMIHTGELHV